MIQDYSSRGYSDQRDITVSITSQTSGQVWIRAPAVGIDTHYSLINGTRELTVSRQIIQTTNNTVENKTIHLLSDTDISVNVITSGTYNEEGSLSLPIRNSSTKYVIPSAPSANDSDGWPSEFIIAALTDSTTVSITLPQNFTDLVANTTINRTLNRYQTFLYQQIGDLSGTLIESSKPISVVAGSKLTRIPEKFQSKGSFVFEQVPSTDYFGRHFIVPTLHGRNNYMIKVFTAQPLASLEFYNSTGSLNFVIHKGKPLQIYNGNEPTFLSSDSPVYVVQYSLDYDVDNTGGEFMMNIPSLSNFMTQYDFFIPSIQSKFYNYLCVVSMSDGVPDIQLDSSPLSQLTKSFINTTEGDFTISTATVSIGKHTVTSIRNNKTIGGLLYGYLSHNNGYSIRGYGFPLGIKATNGEKLYNTRFVEILRILRGCKVRIENSIPMVTVLASFILSKTLKTNFTKFTFCFQIHVYVQDLKKENLSLSIKGEKTQTPN